MEINTRVEFYNTHISQAFKSQDSAEPFPSFQILSDNAEKSMQEYNKRYHDYDAFEQALCPEDVKYFIFEGNSRFPHPLASISSKNEWLSYAKQLEKDGIDPKNTRYMMMPTDTFFPPQNAPTSVKKAWCDLCNTLSNDEISDLKDSIVLSFAKKNNCSADAINATSFERISQTLSFADSYQNFFAEVLENLEIIQQRIRKKMLKSPSMQEIKNLQYGMEHSIKVQDSCKFLIDLLGKIKKF